MKKIILNLILSFCSFNAFSWDGSVTGIINKIDVEVTNGNNYGLRIALKDAPTLCGSTKTWAYINKEDDNYQVTSSMLIAAQMASRQVTLYTTKNASSGYCRIGYVVLY